MLADTPPHADRMPIKLNGKASAELVSFHIGLDFLRGARTTMDVLDALAERFCVIGDITCGYGYSGRKFVSRGKSCVLSDYNGKCIALSVTITRSGLIYQKQTSMTNNLLPLIAEAFGNISNQEDRNLLVSELRKEIRKHSSHTEEPIDLVQWIPVGKMEANDYNPNSVATNEMRLLYHSIMSDGFTQPVVCIYDEEKDKYVLIDGFHRFTTVRLNKDLRDRLHGCVPAVVLTKNMNDRMAATIRHNRARGKHSMGGMSNMVSKMLDQGMTDEGICAELGMEADELIRLKHVTGFSKLFEDVEYRQAWETRKQVKIRLDYEKEHPEETPFAKLPTL